ncbi:MAG: fibronectin type III domain-containing protein, partial [Micrococcales bacterium]|nr:fibronectin type III domain-containing protein [Micrococcales bacterium]
MKLRVIAALLLSSFLLGTAQANAITAVPKATRVVVSTTSTTAKVSWPAFAKSKVTAIKVVATAGSSKTTKSLANTATSHVFTNLKSSTLYTFSVTAFFGSKAGAAVTYKLRTKAKPSLLYNSIFFGAPEDMVVGDGDQQLFALPNGGETTFSTTTP